METEDWAQRAKGVLRAELARKGLSFGDLAERLSAIGVDETAKNLSNKVNRGQFTFAFAIQVMMAIGVQRIDLRPVAEELADNSPER